MVRVIIFSFVSLLVTGCASFGIPGTPEETFEIAQKAVFKDNPQAFYSCLADDVQKQTSFSAFKRRWERDDLYFSIFLNGHLKGIETPAPDFTDDSVAKVTIRYKDFSVAFLFVREGTKWKIGNLRYYPLPDGLVE